MTLLTQSPHRFFLYISLLFGTALALLLPPFQSPDEYNHFYRAWQLSEGHFVPDRTKDNRLGGTLPESVVSLQKTFGYLKNDQEARISWKQIRSGFLIPLEPGRRVFVDFPNTAIYAPPAYLPQALAIRCVRLLQAPPLYAVYLGRICNMLVWSLLLYFAIRLLPFARWGMTAMALLPSSLVVAASLNADVLTNGLSFWLIAYFVHRTAAPESTGKYFRAPLTIAVIAMNKIVFTPLLLLELLGWKRQPLRDYRPWLRLGVLLAAASAGLALWSPVAQRLFLPYDQYHPDYRDAVTLNEGVDPNAQIRWVLEHPGRFAALTLHSYAVSLPSTTAHILGKFGWEKNYLPAWMLACLGLALLLLLCTEAIPWRWPQRTLAVFTALCCVALFSLTMYALWHPVGAPVLTNLQGRYFFPVLPLILLAFSNGFLHRFQGQLRLLTIATLVSGNIIMLWCILLRYYIS